MLRRNILILVLACLLPAFPCLGAEISRTLSENELREIFVEILKPQLPPQVKEVTISNFASEPQVLTLPPGVLEYRPDGLADGSTPGKKFITATLNVDGKQYAEIKMSGELHYWGTVVHLSRNIFRRAILAHEDLQTDYRDISMLGNDLVSDPELAAGKKLKKSLRQGAILYAGLLESPELVKRGDRVTIMARTGAIKVTAPGEAKNGGAAGELVRVKNMMSRRVIEARVVDQGLVEVE